jgi:DNA polymerase I-like protein with 3'-5' exonuclease and polymerase domains
MADDYVEPERRYRIDPTFEECIAYLTYLRDECPLFSVDIETPGGHFGCIGFSDSPYQAFVVPVSRWDTPGQHCWSAAQEAELLVLISEVLANPNSTKILQNGMFDQTYLWENLRILIQGPAHDTMVMHHYLYPDFKKGLGFLTSLYTVDPYYKAEGKLETAKIMKMPDAERAEFQRQYWFYNAKDCDTTLRIYHTLTTALDKRGMSSMTNFLSALHHPIWEMSVYGIRVDEDARARKAQEVRIEIEELQAKLEELIGHPLNTNSPKQMQEWLYVENSLPIKKGKRKDAETGERSMTVTANSDALEEIRKELQGKVFAEGGSKDLWRNSLVKAITCILAMRDRGKFLGTYLECPISADGRIRASFSMAGPSTGRFASRAYLDGTGTNLQNQPKEARGYYLPDPHPPGSEPFVFVNIDLAQAEARVVAFESGDPGLKFLFNSGVDYHTANAMSIWGYETPMDVPGLKRQLAKIGGHATNYGATEHTLALSLGVPLKDAKDFRKRYLARYPGLTEWHSWIKNKIDKGRTLYNAMGRKCIFLSRIDDNLYRSCLAWTPQSTIADVINRAIVNMKSEQPKLRLHLQCHDSLTFSVPYSKVDAFVAWARPHIEIPLISHRTGEGFTIPADFEVGWTYGSMVRYVTPEQEKEIHHRLSLIPRSSWAGLPPKEQKELLSPYIGEIVSDMGVNKDAVISIDQGNSWRIYG